MTETIQSTDLRRRVREVLDRVRLKREPVVVQSYDTPRRSLSPTRITPRTVSGRPAVPSDKPGWLNCARSPRRSVTAPPLARTLPLC